MIGRVTRGERIRHASFVPRLLVLSYLRFHCVFTKVFTAVLLMSHLYKQNTRKVDLQNLAVSESSE